MNYYLSVWQHSVVQVAMTQLFKGYFLFCCWMFDMLTHCNDGVGIYRRTIPMQWLLLPWHCLSNHGPLTRYVECGLRMCRECRERYSRDRHQRKPLVTCMSHVPWCMSGSLTRSRHSQRMLNPQFAYLVRGPLNMILNTGHGPYM